MLFKCPSILSAFLIPYTELENFNSRKWQATKSWPVTMLYFLCSIISWVMPNNPLIQLYWASQVLISKSHGLFKFKILSLLFPEIKTVHWRLIQFFPSLPNISIYVSMYLLSIIYLFLSSTSFYHLLSSIIYWSNVYHLSIYQSYICYIYSFFLHLSKYRMSETSKLASSTSY